MPLSFKVCPNAVTPANGDEAGEAGAVVDGNDGADGLGLPVGATVSGAALLGSFVVCAKDGEKAPESAQASMVTLRQTPRDSLFIAASICYYRSLVHHAKPGQARGSFDLHRNGFIVLSELY